MSIVTYKETVDAQGNKGVATEAMKITRNEQGLATDNIADYQETPEEYAVSSMILKHFVLGSTNMYTPRVEFNDLSLVTRDQYDQMAFNTYQPNNGQAWEGSPQSAWRSRAVRPVVRNKCMSIGAHATARLIFPKCFAYNENSESQEEAARVMEYLMEWSGDQSGYPYYALQRVLTALSSPASIGYTEYGEVMRKAKTHKEDGKWVEEWIRDEAYPCFMDTVVPVTQFYIQNIYEPDIQKQGWVIWRKVYAFSEAEIKYAKYEKFKYVRPGVQTIYDDANQTFYYVYDPNMRSEDVEEIVYWNKNLDLKIIKVNGIMLTEYDNPNPRKDKLYPFDKFGYELINDRFFYYKSLAFKLQHDAEIVNTLYQMVIDGTYLSIFKPMVNVGGEVIASDVIVPGAVTTFSDPNADLRAINVGSDLKAGLETLGVVEQSINESSQEPFQAGVEEDSGGTTAYEISRLENNANTVLGLFLQMIAKHVKDFGRLRLGDIIQYMTLPEVVDITGNPELTYKTFFLDAKVEGDKAKKVYFDREMPDEMEDEEYLDASYDLKQQNKDKSMEIARVNPSLFRDLQYRVTISPDVLNPRSDQLERAFSLELYDRAIANPMADQEEIYKVLLSTDPTTKKDPDKYIMQQPPPGSMPSPLAMGEEGQMPGAGNSPLNAMGGATGAPKSVSTPTPMAGLSK